MKLLATILLICLGLSSCSTAEVTATRDNIRIGPVPIIRIEY